MKPRRGGEPERPGHVALTHPLDDSVVEVVVGGRWTRRTAVDVYDALRKCLAEQPSAIIIDLHGMTDPDGASAAAWIAASQAAATLQPPAHVALSAPPTRQVVSRLRRLGCAQYMSLFATIDQARAAVAGALPLTDRMQSPWLPPTADSLTAVRDVVALACRVWTVPAVAGTAEEVALDLTEDSVTHARTAMLFTICRRSGSLYLALRDREPTLPPVQVPRAATGATAPATRLPVVAARSYVWGASTTHDGKVVWAAVRSRG